MLSVNEIRKNYKRFDDIRIKRIAKKDAKGLRKETIPILIEEIKKRQLGDHLIQWINAERRILSKTELEGLKNKIKECLCSNCQKNRNLKGYTFITITGIIIDKIETRYELIICEKCGRKKRKEAAIWTIVFGWWSFWGLISTPFILIDKIRAIIKEKQQSEALIEAFIHTNIGEITIGGDSKEIIQELLIQFNIFQK